MIVGHSSLVRRPGRSAAAALVCLCLMALVAHAEDDVDFVPLVGWPQLGELELGQTSGVAVDRDGNAYVFHRGKHPILCFNRGGKLVRYWGDELVGSAHGLRIGPQGNVWTTDVGRHVVRKFTREGELLLTLGKEDSPGLSAAQFDKPTDVAFGPKGEIYVSDGYGNSRMVKFSGDGRFVKSWGEPGKEPGQFNLPHTVVVDSQGRVIVGDRENDRVQVFDGEGILQEVWSGFAPFGLAITLEDELYVADGRAHKVLLLDRDGKVVQSWGQQGSSPGEFDLPHMVALDRRGNLYVSEITGQRVQKLQRK